MEFGLDDAQLALKARMRALGAEVDAAPSDERLARLAAGGALGLPLPRDLGGEGLDLVSTALAYESLGETLRDGGVLLGAGAHLFGVALLVDRVGDEAQRRAWLPRMASGEVVATVAATEEAAGSDVGAVIAVAEPRAGGYRFAGEKRYVTMADRAGVFFVVGRDGAGGRGLTALLIPRETNGVEVGEPLPTAGLEGARLAPVAFRGCEVGDEARFGRAGAGLAVFQIAMTFERALVLAFRLGAMRRELDEAVRFCRARAPGGVPVTRHQAVSHRLSRMKLRLETSSLLVYRAAWAIDRSGRGQPEAALAKWHLAESAVESALDAMRLRGGAGYMSPSGLPATLDDALGGTIHSGTGDVLATVVARWLGA